MNAALRKKLPYLRFTFDQFAAGKAEAMVADLFSDANGRGPTWRGVATKLKSDAEMEPLGEVIDHLCSMAENNQLSGATLKALVRLAGDGTDVGEAEPIIDPTKIALSQLPAAGLRAAFQQALAKTQTYTPTERELLEQFILSVSNIEELLSTYFTLFMLARASSEQKTYLYLAWILWAFLWLKSEGRSAPERSIYSRLPSLGGSVITFNYTNFFGRTTGRGPLFFHGRLDRFLRVDDRRVVAGIPSLRGAPSSDRVVSFFNELRLDVNIAPQLDIPVIVPPLGFKPLMSRVQLRTWAEADDLLQNADQIVIVGYSFAVADEHFNDLLRQTPGTTRIVVVNPDLDVTLRRAGAVLGVDPAILTSRDCGGVEVLAARRLTGLKALAEEVDGELLDAALR
ncbi:MAG TPA: hypothetical protein VKT78_04475 [Fimbriimonadaceae bacterium]|nr:hypothetical protein [Fimbriimonadaceae bacterium]